MRQIIALGIWVAGCAVGAFADWPALLLAIPIFIVAAFLFFTAHDDEDSGMGDFVVL